MDEQQGKRDVVGMIRKIVELAMPNLRHYYRITRKARIVAVYACNGEYFTDVQPLRTMKARTQREPVVPRVALPVLWGGPDRGVVCPPVSGCCATWPIMTAIRTTRISPTFAGAAA